MFRVFRLIPVLTLLVGNAFAEEKAAEPESKHPIPPFDFCVAYVLRDPEERDARPDSGDGVAKGRPAGGILNPQREIDVAALAGLVTDQKILTKDQGAKALEAITAGREKLPAMRCYEPHHALVFYTRQGKPVGCVEICFTCNRWRISPGGDDVLPSGLLDLPGFAKLFVEAGLPLTPFKSLEEFEADKKREVESAK
jgi:hypothetical protein